MNSFRRSLGFNNIICRILQEKSNKTCVRYLYNEQFLGIDKYKEARERITTRLGGMKENFYTRMSEQLKSTTPSLIFTEDLKTVIHTCEDTPNEIDTCVEMMKRFHKQNKELRFGTFVFGPVAMRLFYFLKKHDTVQQLLEDPELDGFFDQLKSYYLAMDLYFKNDMFKEILKAFESVQSKRLGETKYPREGIVLVAGSCFKINTPETFQMAKDLISQAREARVTVLRKALGFVVALALKQNEPNIAFEILSNIDRFNNITGNNLKIMSMAALGRLQDAFDILRRVTDQDAPLQTRIRGAVCQEALDTLQAAVEKANDTETSHIFEQLCRSLKESNSVCNDTIDHLVCLPIEPRPYLRETDDFAFRQRGRFNGQAFRGSDRPFGGEQYGRSQDEYQPRRRRTFAGLGDEF